MLALVLCASTTFAGAALLFVVQPLLAKHLLPSFGGSPGTWAACMVFFQGLLLAGYAYAHALARWLPRRAQLAVHGLVVALATSQAAYASVLESPSGSGPPPLQIAQVLLVQIGVSYFVLATTAPLVQRWAAAALGREPYALYALSNAGSLSGLLAYPFAIEPRADLQTQFALWTYAFGGYAALLLLSMLSIRSAPATADAPIASASAPLPRRRLHWLGCAFLPSVMLLAVTSHITVDIASIPLLWIVPLAIYLITFIVAYSRFGGRARLPLLLIWIVSAVGIGFGSFVQGGASLWQQLVAPCLALFAAGLLCHGELARTRPDPAHLTGYYLVIALGGVLGSISVSWLAPALLDDYYELELCSLGVFALLLATWRALSSGQRRALYIGVGICAPLLLAGMTLRARGDGAQGHVVERRRSFLGPLRVIDMDAGRMLTHGRIRHGLQLRAGASPSVSASAPLLTTPTMYFARGTAVERVMTAHATDRARSIGIVGLGVGTLAAYAREGDRVRFYELDEDVAQVARERFTFLHESHGKVELAIGDGRLALDREPSQHFDILVLDAFSSDSVPVHLLTRQAFAIYARHLAPGGVLLANVSNRHLAVDRVVRGSAGSQQLSCKVVQTEADPALHRERVRWAIMMRDASRLDALLAGLPIASDAEPAVTFSDTQASLLSIIKPSTR